MPTAAAVKQRAKNELKLRDLVETAGFELVIALDHPGRFRISTKAKLATVGYVVVTASGFVATFPTLRRNASTPTELVDALEKIGDQS